MFRNFLEWADFTLGGLTNFLMITFEELYQLQTQYLHVVKIWVFVLFVAILVIQLLLVQIVGLLFV